MTQNADDMAIVTWKIPEVYCEENQVIYTVGGGEGMWPAECTNINNEYSCRAVISETKDAPIGTYYELHTENNGCGNPEVWNRAEHTYESPLLGYSRY